MRTLVKVVGLTLAASVIITGCMKAEERDAKTERWLAFCTSCNYENALSGHVYDIKNYSTVCSPKGRRIVETFAEEFMPNAYAALEKARDKALAVQAVFNEKFPSPVQNGADTYGTYCKVLQQLVEASNRYSWTHSMLAYFQLMHKYGELTNDELAKIDEEDILYNNVIDFCWDIPHSLGGRRVLDSELEEFAMMVMPKTYAQWQHLVKEFDQVARLWAEIRKDAEITHAHSGLYFLAVAYKAYEIRQRSDALAFLYSTLYNQCPNGDVDSAKLAEIDGAKAAEMKAFVARLPTMIHDVVKNPYRVITDSMVKLPNGLMMGRTEVTHLQWLVVALCGDSVCEEMLSDDTVSGGWDTPVARVSWHDCQEWIKKLNAATGMSFRLPTEKEWEYACRAGSGGKYGWVAEGVEAKVDDIAPDDGCWRNAPRRVATKRPNMWGLYDMHGNVWEWCQDVSRLRLFSRVCRGGGCNSDAEYCSASLGGYDFTGTRQDFLGFRLAASQE